MRTEPTLRIPLGILALLIALGLYAGLIAHFAPDLIGNCGRVACWKHGKVRYAACWPEGSFIERVIERACADAGLPAEPLPDGLRQRRCGDTVFTFDYDRASVSIGQA